MNRLIRCLIVLAWAASFSAKAMTLEEAQKLALEHNPQLAVLDAERAEAQSKVAAAGLTGSPVLGVAGGGQFEGNREDSEFLPLAYAYAGMNLYNGAQARLRSDLARIEGNKAELQKPFQEFQIKKAVEEIFAEVSLRVDMEALKEKERDLFESHRKKALNRQRAGLIGDSDVIEFELRKADIQRDLETLAIERQEYLKRLAILTGQSRIERIDAYRLPEVNDLPRLPASGAPRSVAAQTLALDQAAITLEKNLRSSQWGPTVDLEGRAGRLPREGDADPHQVRFDVMLVAKMDLFNHRQRQADLQETVAREKKIEALLRAEKEGAQRAIEHGLVGMESLLRKMQIASKNRQAAQRYYRATLSEYERGLKNSPDVAHATEILFEGDYRGLELRYQWAKEKMELEKRLARDMN